MATGHEAYAVGVAALWLEEDNDDDWDYDIVGNDDVVDGGEVDCWRWCSVRYM